MKKERKNTKNNPSSNLDGANTFSPEPKRCPESMSSRSSNTLRHEALNEHLLDLTILVCNRLHLIVDITHHSLIGTKLALKYAHNYGGVNQKRVIVSF